MSPSAVVRLGGMSDIAERFARVTDRFTAVVEGVAPEDWDNPSPCEGWTARDVVGHLTTVGRAAVGHPCLLRTRRP